MSGNAPVSVYTRSKGLTRYPVYIKSTSHSRVPMCGMGLEPDCEQLLYRYFCHSGHPRAREAEHCDVKILPHLTNFTPSPRAPHQPTAARFVRANSRLSVTALRK